MPTIAMPDGSIMPIGDINKLSDEDLDKLITVIGRGESGDTSNLPPVDLRPESLLRIPGKDELISSLPSPVNLQSFPEKIPGLLADAAKKGALPAIGATTGAALGSLTGPYAPLAIPPLESLGSLGGEYLNQKLGITEPSNLQLGLAAAVPPAIRGIGAAFQLAPNIISPGNAIKTLNVAATKEAENLVNEFNSQLPSAALFQQAQAFGTTINLQDTYDIAGRLLKQLRLPSKASQSSEIISQLESLRDWIKPPKSNMPNQAGFIKPSQSVIITPNPMTKTPTELQAQLESFGREIGNLQRGGSDVGALKSVFKALMADIEKTANNSGAGAGLQYVGEGAGAQYLLNARQAFKREQSIQSLFDYIDKSSKILKGQGGDIQFSAKEVMDKIKKDDFFTSSFTDKEQNEIFSLLKKLNTIPSLRPGAGQNVGSYKRIGQVISGSTLGTGIYLASQDPTTTAIATLAGTFAPVAKENISVIAQILSLKSGRTMLKNILKSGPLTTDSLGTLASFLTSQNSKLTNIESTPDLGINSLTQIPPDFQGVK